MIVGQSTQEITNTLPFASNNFSIAANAKAFDLLMGQLYSDPAAAMIREIVANGNDSHKAAGVTTPIRVHIPNILEPWFVVQDFGLGLSAEQVDKVYTTVFESTKDNDNDATGGFGLGSKTPYAVSDSFTVSTIKDGIKNEYLMYRDGNRNPAYMLTSTTETTEGNGVTVTVPFNGSFCTYPEFEAKAKQVLSMFDTAFDCNIEIKHFKENVKDLGDGIYASKQTRGNYVVMAGIAYPIANEHLSTDFRCGLYIEIPNGSVELTPSRESLFYSKDTIAYIKGEIASRVDSVCSKITDGYRECDTFVQRAKYREEWGGIVYIPSENWMYNEIASFMLGSARSCDTNQVGRSLYLSYLYEKWKSPNTTLILADAFPTATQMKKLYASNTLKEGTGFIVFKSKDDFTKLEDAHFPDARRDKPTFVDMESLLKTHKENLKEMRKSSTVIVSKKTDGHFWVLDDKNNAQFIQVSEFEDDDLVIIPHETRLSRSVTKAMLRDKGEIMLAKDFGRRVVYCRTVLARNLAVENMELGDYLKTKIDEITERFQYKDLLSVWAGYTSHHRASREVEICGKSDDAIMSGFKTYLMHKFEIDRLRSWIPLIRKSVEEHKKYDNYYLGSYIKMTPEVKRMYDLLKVDTDNMTIRNFILDGDY